MTAPLLRLRDIHVQRGETDILQDFNWSINAREQWVLFGPNGAGKTTIHNVLLGYLWPTDGTVEVLGETLGQVDVRDLRRSIGIVSDSIRAMLNDEMTGHEVLISGARAHLNIFGEPTAEELDRADELTELAACDPLLRKPFGVMSTGEKQRLMIARALMAQPRLLILDEPCAGLDIAGREFVLSTIQSIATAPRSPSLIFTTHHVEEVMPAFTHAMVLKAGRSFASGPIRKTMTSDTLTNLFEVPIELTTTAGRMNAVVSPAGA